MCTDNLSLIGVVHLTLVIMSFVIQLKDILSQIAMQIQISKQ